MKEIGVVATCLICGSYFVKVIGVVELSLFRGKNGKKNLEKYYSLLQDQYPHSKNCKYTCRDDEMQIYDLQFLKRKTQLEKKIKKSKKKKSRSKINNNNNNNQDVNINQSLVYLKDYYDSIIVEEKKDKNKNKNDDNNNNNEEEENNRKVQKSEDIIQYLFCVNCSQLYYDMNNQDFTNGEEPCILTPCMYVSFINVDEEEEEDIIEEGTPIYVNQNNENEKPKFQLVQGVGVKSLEIDRRTRNGLLFYKQIDSLLPNKYKNKNPTGSPYYYRTMDDVNKQKQILNKKGKSIKKTKKEEENLIYYNPYLIREIIDKVTIGCFNNPDRALELIIEKKPLLFTIDWNLEDPTDFF
eukprot:TRINITY_DN1008_c0_g1_i1.p1 TRINITY_DN1008_c0_g1~~TRINITY_DN1008_c0_g1_i1.p1  ORF type:complete len:353 (+),score=99.89 TRINITY_DN1008_c0_g1_i1:250-1308(+)